MSTNPLCDLPLIENGADIEGIGRLVMAFQYIESELLRIVIGSCMPGKQRAVAILASQLSFRKLVCAFSGIVTGLSSDTTLTKRAGKVARQLLKIEESRNRFVHSHYEVMSMSLRGQAILRRKNNLTFKNGYINKEEWFSPEEIDSLVEDITTTAHIMHEIEYGMISDGIMPNIDD